MKQFKVGLCLFLWLVACSAISVRKSDAACGYGSCNPVKDDMINVHLVPHTHDDVGWLKTVDQYYYGARNDIQNAGVQYVLDSVIPELVNDPNKRFIYVEIAFFARWWNEQEDSMRHIVKGLVNSGRLEFILGGWCMDDEASTHYNAIIDQHSLGFEFLRQNFGDCGRPRVGWQIDPFGHSREQASLFAQFGFDGLFFGRLDYQDKDKRMKDKTMEMVWHGSPTNLGEAADLFTGVLFNGYGPPAGFSWDQFDTTDPIMTLIISGQVADLFTGVLPNLYQPPGGFCFDQFCPDAPIMDDHRLHDYNVDDKVKDFIKAVEDQAKSYKTNHIVMTMGSDFQYQNAHHWYKNMDKLIKYTNALQTTNASKINVLYSTPSCYLYQLNRAGEVWPTKSDDFFPYAHRDHSFWTGYFSSRAALKGYVRETNNLLQACKQLDALAKLENIHNSSMNIHVLKEAMGVAQHHDAVSGTEKQHVANDYALRLALGREECKKVMNDALSLRLIPKGSEGFPGLTYCDLFNISACNFTQNNKQFVMVVYNPLARNVSHFVRLPVIGNAYTVNGPDNEPVETQIIPVTKRTMEIPERKGYISTNELIFQVQLPPLGFSTYFVKMSNSRKLKRRQNSVMRRMTPGEDLVLQNEHMFLKFDSTTGRLKAMTNTKSGVEADVDQDIVYYYGEPGNCSKGVFQPSGAYIFRPNGTAQNWTGPSSAMFVKGPLVQEVHTYFSSWVSQVIRLYTGVNYAEVEWTVGPIPIKDSLGKEVVARFKTELNTKKTFYTDANGREILPRVRDFRETWDLNQTEPVAGNYYPVNSRIYLRDEDAGQQLTVLTDRSEGGASIKDGELELMLHRRLLHDDCLGVGEPLNETGSDGNGLIVRGKMHATLDAVENAAKFHRDLGLKTYMAPILAFTKTNMKYSEYSQYFHTTWSGVKSALPENVHLLTLEQWGGPAVTPSAKQPYLIRLEHIYENGEDASLSQPVTVSLADLFVPFTISSVQELTLGANLPLSDLQRLQWKTEESNVVMDKEDNMYIVKERRPITPLTGPLDIYLNPMQIRTFEVTLQDGIPFKDGDKFTWFS